jgi:hypothetical protein
LVRVGSAGQLGIRLLRRHRPVAEPTMSPYSPQPFGVLVDRREVQRAGQARLLGVVQRRAGGLALGETEGVIGAIQGRDDERVQRGVIRR